PRALEAPMGMSVGLVARDAPMVRLTASNLACAACHAGVTYNTDGTANTEVAWLGAPNTSIDLETYVQEIYAAFKAAGGAEKPLRAAVTTLLPDPRPEEMRTLERFVLPLLRTRMRTLEAGGRPLPFVNGAPGLTNGVAALKMQLRLLPADGYETQRG